MSTTLTLAQLREAVRQRADMQNESGDYSDSFIKDDELNFYVNQSLFELYDLLVQKYGDDYFVAPYYTFYTTQDQERYDLPDDCYKLLGVDFSDTNANDSFSSLKRFNLAERNKYSKVRIPNQYNRANIRYRISGNQLWLTPMPYGGNLVRLLYVPKMTPLSSDSDETDGISGWTEYVIIDAAIKCLQKEESDVSVLMAQKDAIIRRIENAAENRDAGQPITVSDNSRFYEYDSDYPYGVGW